MVVLMIFNQVPEVLQIIRWIDPSKTIHNLIRLSHGKYVRVTEKIDSHVMEFLCDISQGEYHGGTKIYDDTSNNDDPMMRCGDPCEIVVAGFIL